MGSLEGTGNSLHIAVRLLFVTYGAWLGYVVDMQ